MRFGSVLAALAISLAGCTGTLLPGQPGGGPQASAPFRAKLGTLEFKSVSADTAKKLEMLGSNFRSSAPQSQGTSKDSAAVAPALATEGSAGEGASGGSSSDAGAAPSDRPVSSPGSGASSVYNYSSYFSGPFGPMKLESVTEATAPGASGGLTAVLTGVVDPVIADWAPDAGLLSSSATLTADGDLATGTESYPGEFGWRIAYAAPSAREAMYFLISAEKTTVVRLRWVPVVIDRGAIAFDAKAAVERVRAGVTDPAFKSVEEVLGKPGFYLVDESNLLPAATSEAGGGSTSSGSSGSSGGSTGEARADIAIAEPGVATPEQPPASTEPAPLPPEKPLPEPDQPPPEKPSYTWATSDVPIHELQPGGTWGVNLQVIGKYTLWELNYGAVVSKEVMPLGAPTTAIAADSVRMPEEPQAYSYTDMSVYALVDAKTGEVLHLRRPHKYTATPTKL